jgi:hypothetical protein
MENIHSVLQVTVISKMTVTCTKRICYNQSDSLAASSLMVQFLVKETAKLIT